MGIKKLLLILGLLLTSTLHAQIWMQGSIEKISDGDTFRLLANGQVVKIRLYGIDAPESKQDYGPQSKAALAKLLAGQLVKVKVLDTDRYGRSVGEIWLGDTLDVNLWMVQNGHAWWYKAYGKNRPDMGEAEALARELQRGLWATGTPQAPWEWRAERRSAQDKSKPKKSAKKKKSRKN